MSFVTIRDVMASSAGFVMGAVIAALAAVKKEPWKREGRDSAKAKRIPFHDNDCYVSCILL